MKICYIPKTFKPASLEMIQTAGEIIREYQDEGYTLTLRQLYYQFVARGLLANRQTEYKRLGAVINDARLAGLVDWYSIEDRTRTLRGNSHWSSPSEILEGCAQSFRYDLWADQPRRVEVWIEKDALLGVIERACIDLDIDYFACRGYSSQSEQWRAGRRFRSYAHEGQGVLVLHLGDHDPSGIDMTRDNRERLNLFAESRVEIRRIALNMDQVETYSPPPNPAKLTDTRATDYIAAFGSESWELDALEPRVIDRLIRDQVAAEMDHVAMERAIARQQAARRKLQGLADNWED